MGNRSRLLKAAETKATGPTTPTQVRARTKRLKDSVRKWVLYHHEADYPEEQEAIKRKIRAAKKRIRELNEMLGRMEVVSEADRIIGAMPIGERKLATEVDEAAEIGDLNRTTRLLTSLKRAGNIATEVTSLMEGDRRVRRRWWWRVR